MYAISSRQYVILKVYDILGNEISTLVDEEKPAGIYKVTFNSTGLSSGVYYYRMIADDFIQTKSMLLIK
jgi:cytochrome c biogenesis protein ResB